MPDRIITLGLEVKVPHTVGENEVEQALNAALDESGDTSNDWGDWEVGAVTVISVAPAEEPPFNAEHYYAHTPANPDPGCDNCCYVGWSR